ncbi:MAG TPA: glycosyltransferase family 2 protein [Devosia sp.]|nr:glycosyltransferase family 2 protein [Devosia sp.]
MAKITVLLATYNGARFLDEQLASLAAQDVPHFDIVVSDDGSTDGTLDILGRWRKGWNKGTVKVRSGPAKGFAENFRSLLLTPGISDGYVAFCDQDDVWDPDKLSAAVAALAGESGPAVYGARTRLVDEQNKDIGYSPLFERQPSFRNAIVQSYAGGNTMTLNPAAAALVTESCKRTGFVSHDWWSYLLVTGAGGRAIYDPQSHIAYRQHESNLVGNNRAILAKLGRIKMLLRGTFSDWNERNLASLRACSDMLDGPSRETMEKFAKARASAGWRGVTGLADSRVYRQTVPGNVSLWVAALFGKI